VRCLLPALFAAVLLPHLTPAAPVPKHLMKEPVYYYPTTVGAKWAYEDDLVRVVSKVEERDGIKVVTVERGDGDQRTPYEVVEVSATGLVRTECSVGKLNPPYVLLKAPFKIGDSWTFDSPGSPSIAASQGTCVIASVEQIKVPAGTFEAVRVDVDYTINIGNEWRPEKIRSWYAPNVGLVKMTNEKGEIVWLLKSFSSGKR
jgi:hypothetical protein